MQSTNYRREGGKINKIIEMSTDFSFLNSYSNSLKMAASVTKSDYKVLHRSFYHFQPFGICQHEDYDIYNVLNLHQTFTDYVSSEYIYFDLYR